MSAVQVYYRSGEIIVVPQAGGGGHWVDIEPIEVVPPQTAAVQSAVERALEISAANPEEGAPVKGWKTPLLKRFGVKSYKAFMQGASLCLVLGEGGILDVERWEPRRDGRGYEPALEGGVRLHGTKGVGEAVLQALRV